METIKEIILNITKRCPYFCSFCLLDAIPYFYDIRNPPLDENDPEIWKGIIHQLTKEYHIEEIDISGGDPLFYTYCRKTLEEILCTYQHDIFSISTTGMNYQIKLQFLDRLDFRGRIELTIDIPPSVVDKERGNYNKHNYRFSKILLEKGYKVSIVSILRINNLTFLKELSESIAKLSPLEWVIIPYYPVGRGLDRDLLPTKSQLLGAYLSLLRFSEDTGIPIRFQHSTYFILRDILEKFGYPRKIVSCEIPYQIGVLPNGDVLLCPWGLNSSGEPFSWNYIGNIKRLAYSPQKEGKKN